MPYAWKIELNSADITSKVDYFSIFCGINHFCRELTFNIIDKALYDALDFSQLQESPEVEVFTKIADSWVSQGKFYIERPTFIAEINSERMSGVWGRSETAALAEPFAPKVKKVWESNTTFFAICQEMCDLVGYTWNQAYSDIGDFVIYPYTYEADNIYPINVISELAMLAGAIVTTNRTGHLCIRQINYSPSSEDHTITDADINTIMESCEWPTFGNRVRIVPTGSLASYSVELFIPNECLQADGSSKAKLYAQVRDQDGNPLNGIVVDWEEDSDTASLSYEKSNTQEVLVQNERQQATGYHSVDVSISPSSVDGIWAYTDTSKSNNLVTEGYEIDGKTITLTNKLAYCDQSLVISYRAEGMAVNYLEAGAVADDVTVNADVEGQRATGMVYVDNPCQCPPSIRLTAAPSSIIKNEVARLLVYVEESGPVTSGRIVFMSDVSELRKGALQWTTARLGKVAIKNEKTAARNEIAGITQCELSMYPASVASVYQVNESGNPTGGNLYLSHDGKTINLSSSLPSGTDLMVNYVAQGAAQNLFTGFKLGEARFNAYIKTTSEEGHEDFADIDITDKSETTDDYPYSWDKGEAEEDAGIEEDEDDGDYGGSGGYDGFDFDFDDDPPLCRKSDGTKIQCAEGESCCSDGFTVDCRPASECVGGDIDPCYPASIEGEPDEEALEMRFAVGIEAGCTCEEMCNNEFGIYGTTQDYDNASGRDISEIVVEDYELEEGSPEYWEKYYELKEEALAECEKTCAQPVEFDDEHNPETIVAGSSVSLAILNGIAPFIFSTESLGYYFDEELTQQSIETNDRNVTVYCVDGICEIDYDVTVEINVTDVMETTDSTVLRNSEGEWVFIEEGVNAADTFWVCGEGNEICSARGDLEQVSGHQKWVITFQTPCARKQDKNYWESYTSEDPPCGGPWDCSKVSGSCGYNEEHNKTCYCAAEKVKYYEWECP